MKPTIQYVGSLMDTRDYADAQVHYYKSDAVELYFDANFVNDERINGTDIYDVIVTYVGKRRPRQTDLIEVPRIEEVRKHISTFFKKHGLSPAQNPARKVYFRRRRDRPTLAERFDAAARFATRLIGKR
jgi:hypothetical protein